MNCSGTPHPFNIQASYLKNLLTPLSKPFKVFEFEFQKVINDEMYFFFFFFKIYH